MAAARVAAPPRRHRRRPRRRRRRADPVARASGRALLGPEDKIGAALADYKVAKTARATLDCLTRIAETVEEDEELGLLSAEYKQGAMKQLKARRDQGGDDVWNEINVIGYRALQRALDPLRTSELAGYLGVAGALGGVLYLGLIFVQANAPESFPFAYILSVALFTAPFFKAFLTT